MTWKGTLRVGANSHKGVKHMGCHYSTRKLVFSERAELKGCLGSGNCEPGSKCLS